MNNFADNSDSFWERIIIWLTIAYIEIKTSIIQFIFPIATSLITSMGLSDIVLSSWSAISPSTAGVLAYLYIPEGINTILSAFVTRFIMDMMP
jgi:hypothetical protein